MEKKGKLTRRIHTRVTEEKYRELSALMKRSRGIRSHSELLRNILDNRTISVQDYDASLDKVMEQLSAIRTELQRIGTNINQITRSFHHEERSERRVLQAFEVEKMYSKVGGKVEELYALITKISEKWLPGS